MEAPLNIAVCEDNKQDMDLFFEIAAQQDAAMDCDGFSSGEELLAAFEPGKYDVIFLDIYMTGITGVETAAKIRRLDDVVMLCFITTSRDFTLESYRLGALKYIEKPLTKKDIQEVIRLAAAARKAAPAITLLMGGKRRPVPLDSIVYFEQVEHLVIVNTLSGPLRTGQPMQLSDIMPMLPPDSFIRCHHSFIAHLRYASHIDNEIKLLHMTNGGRVYIRRESLKKTADALERYRYRLAREGVR